MNKPHERLVCPTCGEEVDSRDVSCPACDAPLERMLVKRATRGRRYVYGKRKAGLSPEVIWLLVVILLGLLLIVGAQLYAFMRSRKLVEAPTPPGCLVRWRDRVPSAAATSSLPLQPCGEVAASRVDRTARTPVWKGIAHEVRLRHLCHADCTAGRGHPGARSHWV